MVVAPGKTGSKLSELDGLNVQFLLTGISQSLGEQRFSKDVSRLAELEHLQECWL